LRAKPRWSRSARSAPIGALYALRDHLGFARNVLVQASCHGSDNAAIVAAMRADPTHLRGVAVVDPAISDAELRDLDAAGVRGVRFNFLKRLVDPAPREVLLALAGRVADLGWHVVVYFEGELLDELTPFLKALPVPVLVDHMGRPDVAAGVEAPGFTAFRRLVEDPKFWVKVCGAERVTAAGPPYDDVVPFGRALVADHPGRVLWGTDWPHPNLKSHVPDDGALVDLIPRIAPTEALRQALLVDNPMRLYWG
jgi:2-pyrone-4,6-dicarboxylate lactonase